MMYQKLNITAAGPALKPRFKFRAVDGTDRYIFEVEHASWRIHGDVERNFVDKNFINQKIVKAANIIIAKYEDRININREASYFVSTSYEYRGKKWGIGIPLHWKSPSGDSFIWRYTHLNCGKLTTFIAEEYIVQSTSKHPNDIPIVAMANHATVIYV